MNEPEKVSMLDGLEASSAGLTGILGMMGFVLSDRVRTERILSYTFVLPGSDVSLTITYAQGGE